jgi:L-asparaginase
VYPLSAPRAPRHAIEGAGGTGKSSPAEAAAIQAENLIRIGSASIGPAEWLQLAQRINALLSAARPPQGVVVTHGTATLEESAYFLHLTVKSERPVVVTGTMRPPTALGTDADLNLVDAIRLAACPGAAGRGVLTVLNNEIQSTRDVTKTNAVRVETFSSRELGGADGVQVDALRQHGTDGLVLAGSGGGSYPGAFLDAGKRAVQAGIPVVLATRSTAGRVIMTPQKAGAGFIVSDDLLPQKARILLMLALSMTRDRRSIQELFYRY